MSEREKSFNTTWQQSYYNKTAKWQNKSPSQIQALSQYILAIMGLCLWPLRSFWKVIALGWHSFIDPCLYVSFSQVPWAESQPTSSLVERKWLKSWFEVEQTANALQIEANKGYFSCDFKFHEMLALLFLNTVRRGTPRPLWPPNRLSVLISSPAGFWLSYPVLTRTSAHLFSH